MRIALLAFCATAMTVVISVSSNSSANVVHEIRPTTTTTTAPTYHGHPMDSRGYVTDGSVQKDDAHCSTPPGSGGPEPGQDHCLAARHGGYVSDGDIQLDDEHCSTPPGSGGPEPGTDACLRARHPIQSPWPCMGHYESGNNPAENTGNGFYGEWQDTIGSWNSAQQALGVDYAPRADLATEWQQYIVNQEIQRQQGWGAWPQTSRMCGAWMGDA
jgi:hypothetical protein